LASIRPTGPMWMRACSLICLFLSHKKHHSEIEKCTRPGIRTTNCAFPAHSAAVAIAVDKAPKCGITAG
jgi:hypothetical protein